MGCFGLPLRRFRRLFAAHLIAAASFFPAAAARRTSAFGASTAAAAGAAPWRTLLGAENAAVLARRMVISVMAAEWRLIRIVHNQVLIAPFAVAVFSIAAAGALRLFMLRRRDAPLGHSIAEIARAE
jgi:hypothetical protein